MGRSIYAKIVHCTSYILLTLLALRERGTEKRRWKGPFLCGSLSQDVGSPSQAMLGFPMRGVRYVTLRYGAPWNMQRPYLCFVAAATLYQRKRETLSDILSPYRHITRSLSLSLSLFLFLPHPFSLSLSLLLFLSLARDVFPGLFPN